MAFIEINDRGRPFGWITFELFETECPKACYNFRMLCTGELGNGSHGQPLCYRGTRIFRIIPGVMVQGGDVVNNDGTSGESAFGSIFFEDDTSPYLHDRAGLLCTASLGRPNTNTSQFYITTGPCPWQDGRDVVFGTIVGGMKVLSKLDQRGTAKGGVQGDIVIVNSGLLPDPHQAAAPPQTPSTPEQQIATQSEQEDMNQRAGLQSAVESSDLLKPPELASSSVSQV